MISNEISLSNDENKASFSLTTLIADVNVVAVHEYRPINLSDESMEPITLQRKNLNITTERIKLIKHAKRLGFNSTEIRELLVYWNK